MSRNWYLHCVKCDEDSWLDGINHGDGALATMARAAPLLFPLLDEVAFPDLHVVEVTLNGRRVPLDWFARHAGHPLCLRDEYGGSRPLEPARAGAKHHIDRAAGHLARARRILEARSVTFPESVALLDAVEDALLDAVEELIAALAAQSPATAGQGEVSP